MDKILLKAISTRESVPDRRRVAGFSLVELLVALFVFSILSGFAYHAVNVLWASTKETEMEEEALAGLQRTFLLLEKDLLKAVDIKPSSVAKSESASEASQQFLFRVLKSPVVLPANTSGYIGTTDSSYAVRQKTLYRINRGSAEGTSRVDLPLLQNVSSINFDRLGGGTGMVVTIDHDLLGVSRRIVAGSRSQANGENGILSVVGDLDTLHQPLLVPTTVGGEVINGEDEIPVVPDEADEVADGW